MTSEQTPLMRVDHYQPSGEAGEEATESWLKRMVNPLTMRESFRLPEASTVSYALLYDVRVTRLVTVSS